MPKGTVSGVTYRGMFWNSWL